jgi:hypothetical protein
MGKEFKKKKKFHGPFSSAPACCYSTLTRLRARARPTSRYRSADTDSRDPPVGAFFPQILPCSTLTCRRWRVPRRSVVHASIPSHHSAATCVPTPWSRRVTARAAWRLVDAVVCAPPCFSLRRQDAGANCSMTRPSSSPLHWPSCRC